MITILVSWLLLILMFSIPGIVIKEQFKLTNNKAFILFYGIIFQTVFTGVFAFFHAINEIYFIVNSFLILILSYFFKNRIKDFFISFFKEFSNKTKFLFLFYVIIIALKSAQSPSIFDNETYYIQTIKWLNEFGFVKGLSNIHPFLAQCSFWHVLQSGCNFSFITSSLNDINGLLLLIGIYYFVEKSNQNSNLFISINSLFLIIYFQFIDAPSPDLPILVFLSILFYEFTFEKLNNAKIKTLLLFIVYLLFIKLTTLPFLLLAIYLVIKDKKTISFFTLISLGFGILWILKNSIITGYPLFPLSIFDWNLDWKLPVESMDYMYKNIINLGYADQATLGKDYSIFEKLNYWFQLKGINRIFNLGIIFLLLLTPFTKLYKTISNFKTLYIILVIHFIFLLLNSPQYRFFLPTFILLGSVLIYEIHRIFSNQIANFLLVFSGILLIFSLFMDIKEPSKSTLFNYSQIVQPESNSKYNTVNFQEIEIGNLKINSPFLPNLYETADGNLPCVNQKLLDFYSFYPQLRTSSMEDGFYSKKIKDE